MNLLGALTMALLSRPDAPQRGDYGVVIAHRRDSVRLIVFAIDGSDLVAAERVHSCEAIYTRPPALQASVTECLGDLLGRSGRISTIKSHGRRPPEPAFLDIPRGANFATFGFPKGPS